MVVIRPALADLDMEAVTESIVRQYLDLPADDRARLEALTDLQGGFPWSWQRDDDGIHVLWADVEIAFVPYELVLRAQPPRFVS